jgi:hypothetical protein
LRLEDKGFMSKSDGARLLPRKGLKRKYRSKKGAWHLFCEELERKARFLRAERAKMRPFGFKKVNAALPE